MKHVGITQLKARLSQYLRAVRGGESLIVSDRGKPVARMEPYEAPETLQIRPPLRGAGRLADVPLPPPVHLDVDVLDVLAQERSDR